MGAKIHMTSLACSGPATLGGRRTQATPPTRGPAPLDLGVREAGTIVRGPWSTWLRRLGERWPSLRLRTTELTRLCQLSCRGGTRCSDPLAACVGRIPGAGSFSPVADHSDVQRDPVLLEPGDQAPKGVRSHNRVIGGNTVVSGHAADLPEPPEASGRQSSSVRPQPSCSTTLLSDPALGRSLQDSSPRTVQPRDRTAGRPRGARVTWVGSAP